MRRGHQVEKGGEKGKRNKKFKRQTKTVKKLHNIMLLWHCLHVYMSNIVKDLRYFRVQMKKKKQVKFNYNNDY